MAASKWGRLAQLVEQLTLNQRVVGSNPSASTISTYSACFFPNGLFSLTIFRFRIAAKLTHAR
jgi:hypothetical protein